MLYQGTLKLLETKTVARETISLKFRVSSLSDLKNVAANVSDWDFAPGQFVSLECGEKIWRAYSIASVPDTKNQTLELVVRVVPNGKGSNFLNELKPNDPVNFKGPFGHFQLSENKERTLIFCGTGTGIAPLRSMILAEAQSQNPRAMIVLYGGRDTGDIAYLDEIESWSKNLTIHLGLSRDPEANNFKPYAQNTRITQFLEDKVYPQNSEFYICGNGDMVKSVQETLESQSIGKEKIFMERFN